MTILFRPSIQKKITKLLRKHPHLLTRLDEAFSFLTVRPPNPSLRLHKLQHRRPPTWSVSVTEDIRVLFVYVEEGILIVDIGPHDEVYGK